ncbi:hypothetical protein KEJ50_04625 [Candidatus Bathyarchaeota archaeon]|nr:hypothetical protein [Candidatus Bathyarchaeota archaeon]
MKCLQNNARKLQFQEALLNAIDETLLTLGESVKQAIYYHIKQKYNITREEVLIKLKEFYKALEEIFGFGVKILEKLIVKNFYRRINLNFEEHAEWDLIEYIEHAKEVFFI